jgi:predicted ribosome quality control (RQC) complex YloA/Tae2 family protein
MNAAMGFKEIHDELLANPPSGVSHDAADCPLCAMQGEETLETPKGGENSLSTFTQDDIDAAVAAATKPFEDKLKDLLASQEQAAVEERIAKERAELEQKVAEVQSQLDSAVLEAAEAKKVADETVAYLQAVKAEEEQATEIAKRKEDRLTMVREVASFPDEYIEANADRWAALADEDFEALTNDWKAIATKGGDSSESSLPGASAMVASRQDGKPSSAVKDIFDLTLNGFDPKTLGSSR